MKLIVETDLGHDPDDFFALCYLIAAGVEIKTILISPGDPDQIAIARLLCDRCGLNIPIGAAKAGRTKMSSGSIHHEILKQFNYSLMGTPDGLGHEILEDVVPANPDIELFVIGPVSSLGKYITKHPSVVFSRATMQGGFLPYSLHRPGVIHPDFDGKEWMPTFNLNGDRLSGVAFLNANIAERRMVGKNVCHTIYFDPKVFAARGTANGRAAELFDLAARLYFERHEGKKFHDPTAACLHLHPEIGTWYSGKTIKQESGWTTVPGDDLVLADVDREKLWDYLMGLR